MVCLIHIARENLINTSLPTILAGPMLRHCDAKQVTFWLVTSKPYRFGCKLLDDVSGQSILERHLSDDEIIQTKVGEHAYINHLTIHVEPSLPQNSIIYYDLNLVLEDEVISVTDEIPELLYDEAKLPSFVIKPKLKQVLHGSCRKPHFDSSDGLKQVDELIKQDSQSVAHRPSILMMSGDQVYVDDVAGPTLNAIHQVINLLGLFDEHWQNPQTGQSSLTSSSALYSHNNGYYQRHLILPNDRVNKSLLDRFLPGNKKPIFTSVNAKNHLITLSEVIAQYLLVWSPTLWSLVNLENTSKIPDEFKHVYQTEKAVIHRFVNELTPIRRALAHIPSYMIFDDHDITDDWNLTRGWEEAAYEHPFSKRIIGNALIGYYLCQGLGNGVDNLTGLSEQVLPLLASREDEAHEQLVAHILDWEHWHYELETSPKMIVLDTRTQRWRSESNSNKPSGLMDWESLSELQQKLINQPSIILVSPAPIYGVKLIEAVQRIFTFFGKPLAVDAENWMAHPGTANVMLNIFRHHKTPPHFIILSGDVHYSFVYDVTHRFVRNSSNIIQITASGIKNTFPSGLLSVLERLNYVLYGRFSPLNWFTKRRRMRIKVRLPDNRTNHTLYNGSGIGLMTIEGNGTQVEASILAEKGNAVHFELHDKDND